ncbi:MAG: hypothetical protein ACI87E_005113 [Mariniblastus sp.]|jgi:hypothetical protein
MPRITFSIRTLLLAVTVVALYFPTHAFYDPWQQDRLRVSHHMYHDFTVLAKLSEGDSVEDVCSNYTVIDRVDRDALREQLVGLLSAMGTEVELKDEFYEYTVHGEGNFGYLQFRDGKLVNHSRDRFNDPVANTLRNGAQLPGAVDRMGVWPIYGAVVTLFLAAWLTLERTFAKSRERPAEP